MARFAFASLLLCAAVTIAASSPTFWRVATEAEFMRGDIDNLSVDTFGRLTLGPTMAPVYETSAPFVWTVASGPDGSVYAGSGNEGQVFRIDSSGRGSVFFDTDELEVHALAIAPGGALYVGTSPNGKVYKVDQKGVGTVFFDPEDRYIWSLAVDRTGNVFVATGDKGVIYKVTPDGTGAPFYETKATHVMTLAFDRDGRLLAGTESPGRVFSLDAAGKPFVLLDSSYNEIHTLRVDAGGNIYVAALTGRAPAPAPAAPAPTAAQDAPPLTASVSTEITVVAVAESAQAAAASRGASQTPAARGPATGAIYRILPDGAWDLLWESRQDTPFDVAVESAGTILVATGNSGKIYRLAGDPYQPTLVTRANVQQVTGLLVQPDGRVIAATANPGKVLRLSTARAERGSYLSDVRDAQTVALWGTIAWEGSVPDGTRLDIATRSGNTSTPDETWSDWSAAYANRGGSQMVSPRGRYLQWRATFVGARGETPLLTSVTAAYLPRNVRPRVTSITVHPPGTVFQRPFPTDPEIAGFEGDLPDRRTSQQPGQPPPPTLGRRVYEKGLMTFVWRAEDDNNDDLSYDVFYRREGETSWKPLKRALSGQILVWDTTSVPNGRYTVRIVASDAPSNAPSTALSGSRESAAFDIDNVPPTVTVASVRRENGRLTIAFDVRDANSSVQKVEYSLDGDRWQTIYPKDGIADSGFEQFELVLDGEAAARGVTLRATDSLNNVSSARGDAAPAGGEPGSGRR